MMLSLIEIAFERENYIQNVERNENQLINTSSNIHLDDINLTISTETSTTSSSTIKSISSSLIYPCYWRCVHEEIRTKQFNDDEKKRLYENLFNWKAFTKRVRSQIIVGELST